MYLHSGENIASEKVLEMLEYYQGKLKYKAAEREEPYFQYQMKAAQSTKKKQITEELFQAVSELIRGIGGLYEEK